MTSFVSGAFPFSARQEPCSVSFGLGGLVLAACFARRVLFDLFYVVRTACETRPATEATGVHSRSSCCSGLHAAFASFAVRCRSRGLRSGVSVEEDKRLHC